MNFLADLFERQAPEKITCVGLNYRDPLLNAAPRTRFGRSITPNHGAEVWGLLAKMPRPANPKAHRSRRRDPFKRSSECQVPTLAVLRPGTPPRCPPPGQHGSRAARDLQPARPGRACSRARPPRLSTVSVHRARLRSSRLVVVRVRDCAPCARARRRYNGGRPAFAEPAANPRRRLGLGRRVTRVSERVSTSSSRAGAERRRSVPAGEPEPPELVVWHEFLDQRKELSLLKPDVCVKQFSRRIQRLSVGDPGRHRNLECASEPRELHVLDACLAEGSRLRLDVSEEKREELFFLIAKVDTLFVPEELHEVPGRRQPTRSISVRGSTAQPQCLHESIVMVARERDQGGVALHCTLGAVTSGDSISI
jgi:hypothetical protein